MSMHYFMNSTKIVMFFKGNQLDNVFMTFPESKNYIISA